MSKEGPPPKVYRAQGENQPGGEARVETLAATITFDGSQSMGDSVPGPAHLLAASLAACVLKNVERFSHILPFAYQRATVDVQLTRQSRPPRIVSATYQLDVDTDEPAHRCALLHKNIRKFGTISNTLALACTLSGSMSARRSTGQVEEIETDSPGGS